MNEKTLQDYTPQEIETARQAILKHRGKALERMHSWYLNNKKRKTERMHQQYEDNRDKRIEQGRLWRAANRERMLELLRRYCKEHPEAYKTAHAKRRAQIANSVGNFTSEEFKLLCEAFENKCVYCMQRVPLGPDHVVPLSKGESNNISNIVPACTACNRRKHTMTYDEYLKRLEDEGRETKT